MSNPQPDMSVDSTATRRASRYRVARSRGTLSGVLLLLLGAWAALVPFFGPYLNIAYTPQPNTAWHWTAARGWLEVLPGAVAFAAGLLLIMSASRVVTSLCAWIAAAAGAWLLIGPTFAGPLHINLGTPDPTSRRSVQSLDAVLFFYGVGALIVFIAGIALGRLTVNTVRDQRAAERRLAAEEAAAREAGAAVPAEQSVGAPGSPGYQPERSSFFRRHQDGEPAAGPQGTAPQGPGGYQGSAPQPPGYQGQPGAEPAAGQPAPNGQDYASAPPPPRST